jgi:hypothetical protein
VSADPRPAGYRLVTPDGWWRVDLAPDRREQSVERLVRQQFAGLDDAPIERRQVTAEVLAQAERAYATGGVELYLSTLVAGVLPLSSSLVVSFTPGVGEPMALQALADEVAHSETAVQVVSSTVEELPCGPAVRRVARMVVPMKEEQEPAPSLSVDWHLPVPHGAGDMLSLSFATPVVALEDALTELFDAVAATFTWVAS